MSPSITKESTGVKVVQSSFWEREGGGCIPNRKELAANGN